MLTQFEVHMDAFDGPLELLYQLIERNKVDIYDIPIAEITEQYLAAIEEIRGDRMDSMSDFLLMAATLLEIKSKMLLPKPPKDEPEQDPREELINRLTEYKRFREAADALRSITPPNLIYKPPDAVCAELMLPPSPDSDELLDGVTAEALAAAFREALLRRELKTDRVRAGFNAVQKDPYTVEKKIAHLREMLARHTRLSFFRVMERAADRLEMVTTFLALLEMIKLKEIEVAQETNFSDIEILRRGAK